MIAKVLDEVHLFWFGRLDGPDRFPQDKIPLWFGNQPETDAAIRERFGAIIDEAAATDWRLEDLTPRQRVALMVLLDQFPRNCFRGTARVYAHDALAAGLARKVVALPMDGLSPIEKMFAVIALGHSESLDDQEFAVKFFAEKLRPEAGDHPFWAGAERQVHLYSDIIARFGRFPHRNEILGRNTTAEEAAFMAETKMAPG